MRDSENWELTPEEKQATLEELDRWQAVIDTPEKWTKGAFARDSIGTSVNPSDARACRFCLLGAEEKADVSISAFNAIRGIVIAKGQQCAEFNDDPSTTHADVMALFERAKEKVRNA